MTRWEVVFANGRTMKMIGEDEADVARKLAPYCAIAGTEILTCVVCLECLRTRAAARSAAVAQSLSAEHAAQVRTPKSAPAPREPRQAKPCVGCRKA